MPFYCSDRWSHGKCYWQKNPIAKLYLSCTFFSVSLLDRQVEWGLKFGNWRKATGAGRTKRKDRAWKQ